MGYHNLNLPDVRALKHRNYQRWPSLHENISSQIPLKIYEYENKCEWCPLKPALAESTQGTQAHVFKKTKTLRSHCRLQHYEENNLGDKTFAFVAKMTRAESRVRLPDPPRPPPLPQESVDSEPPAKRRKLTKKVRKQQLSAETVVEETEETMDSAPASNNTSAPTPSAPTSSASAPVIALDESTGAPIEGSGDDFEEDIVDDNEECRQELRKEKAATKKAKSTATKKRPRYSDRSQFAEEEMDERNADVQPVVSKGFALTAKQRQRNIDIEQEDKRLAQEERRLAMVEKENAMMKEKLEIMRQLKAFEK